MTSTPTNPSTRALPLVDRRLLFVGLPLWLFLVAALPRPVHAQEASCDDALSEATNRFFSGLFNQAAGLLETCLQQNAFSDAEKAEVYKLLVQIYDARGLAEQVRTALAALLNLVPNFEPAEDDPPPFKALVEAFKDEIEQQAARPPALPPVAPRPALEVTLATPQGDNVENVQLREDNGQLRISYDLVGSAKRYEVSLLLSIDGGQTFEALPQRLAGEVGKDITPGRGKNIVWVALSDFPQGLTGDQYRLQVVADKQGGKGLLYVLGGAVLAGGGTTVALLLGGGGGGDDGETGCPPNCPTQPTPIPTPPGRPGGN